MKVVKNKDKLLIFDLDETLIHATETPLVQHSDFLVYTYHIYKRPHLDTFLKTCLDWFDVAVWTSSGSEYAAEVVNTIFPDPQALAFVWTSDRCSIVSDGATSRLKTRQGGDSRQIARKKIG